MTTSHTLPHIGALILDAALAAEAAAAVVPYRNDLRSTATRRQRWAPCRVRSCERRTPCTSAGMFGAQPRADNLSAVSPTFLHPQHCTKDQLQHSEDSGSQAPSHASSGGARHPHSLSTSCNCSVFHRALRAPMLSMWQRHERPLHAQIPSRRRSYAQPMSASMEDSQLRPCITASSFHLPSARGGWKLYGNSAQFTAYPVLALDPELILRTTLDASRLLRNTALVSGCMGRAVVASAGHSAARSSSLGTSPAAS